MHGEANEDRNVYAMPGLSVVGRCGPRRGGMQFGVSCVLLRARTLRRVSRGSDALCHLPRLPDAYCG